MACLRAIRRQCDKVRFYLYHFGWHYRSFAVTFKRERINVSKADFSSFFGRGVVCTSLALIAVAAAAGQPEADISWKKETIQEFAAIDEGGTVSVDNPYGNIYARFGGYENEVEILATVQQLDGELPGLKLGITRAGAGLDVTVKPADPETAMKTNDRIDLVVFVPQGARLDARTVEDLIEAKGLKGDLFAISEKGDIRFRSIGGKVSAKTSRGDISAALETGATEESQELSTITGDIEVYLWEDAAMNVDIRTSGEISTDFSMKIEHHRFEEPGKHATATVGAGGPKLSLYSKRGRIKLLRLQKDFKPEAKGGNGGT
jgi:hypothetical protein